MNTLKIPFSKEEKHSIFLTVLTLITGYAISLFTSADVFSRSGAIIVCIGIYISMLELTKSIDAALKNSEVRLKKLTKKHNHPTPNKEINKIAAMAKKEMRGKGQALKSRILRTEGYILIVGTLTWGFGDLLVPSPYILDKLFS